MEIQRTQRHAVSQNIVIVTVGSSEQSSVMDIPASKPARPLGGRGMQIFSLSTFIRVTTRAPTGKQKNTSPGQKIPFSGLT